MKAGSRQGAFWPLQRLGFTRAWPVTRGAGVLVAVIDSGLNTGNPQLRHVHTVPGHDVVKGFAAGDTRDCYGHGTAVTGIIAGRPDTRHTFTGVAPDATVLPIKQTNTQSDNSGTSAGLAAAIDYAVAQHADVANVSVAVTAPTRSLQAAVARARRNGMVIVAAAGNDGAQSSTPAYPAAYSTRFANVIAVSAIDATDQVAQFSDSGRFVTVAAPGVKIPVPASDNGYYTLDGTSFAAPFVTGTVALMLAAHPGLTPSQVRDRLEATADPPPTAVPSPTYGYGVIDPYLAVTATGNATVDAPSATRAAPVPAPQAERPPSRHVQHVALAVALVLLGVIVLVFAGAAALRGPRRQPDERARRDRVGAGTG